MTIKKNEPIVLDKYAGKYKKDIKVLDVLYGDYDLKLPKLDVSEFLSDNFDYEVIREVYEYEIDEDMTENKCAYCDEICDLDSCDYVRDARDYKRKYEASVNLKSVDSAKDIVHEYYKLNTTLPADIIKELETRELTNILKEIGYEQPHICRCKQSKH